MKTISIFGSTGAVGKKSVVIALYNNFQIIALTCNNNHTEIIKQAKLCIPKYVCVCDINSYKIVKEELKHHNIIVVDYNNLNDITTINVDISLMAIEGNAGIAPTFDLLGHTKRLAIATKEVIISGGTFFMQQAQQKKTEIIPIDSEHNALFQCLQGEKIETIEKLWITASGGPFVNFSEQQLNNVTIAEALKNPNWNMGKKITIDSATLINKALEIIEAAYLFNIPIKKISSIIHTNSIIHAITQFKDGQMKASIYHPDMIYPISYALNFPERKIIPTTSLNLEKLDSLSFQQPSFWQQRNISLAYQSFAEKKVIAFNTANAFAVQEFLMKKINFIDIYKIVANFLDTANHEIINSFEDIKNIILETKDKLKKFAIKL